MKILVLTLLFATAASAQVNCQTGPYNHYAGTTTTCNGTLTSQPAPLQVQPVQNYSAIMASAAQANAAQANANAQMLQAQAQAQLSQQQAELARQQAEYTRQQTEALARQQVDMTHRQEVQPPRQLSVQDVQAQHAAVATAVAGDTTLGLRAKAATLEAVLRSSPPDSDSFRNATGALLTINMELAKRGELK